MKLVSDYFRIQKEIYDYFGFTEEWTVIPIDDRRECYWRINKPDQRVEYWMNKNNVGKWLDDDGYSDEIMIHRFWDTNTYRKDDYTMIMVDTHCDGNRFLAIYDNEKEVK